MRRRPCVAGAVGAAFAAAALGGCAGVPGPQVPTAVTKAATPGPAPAVEVSTVAEGLDAPWGLVPLDDGRLVVVDPDDGSTTPVAGPGAEQLVDRTVPGGEGGLLGIALGPEGSDAAGDLFVYRTGAADNAVLAGSFDGARLGGLAPIVEGIPRGTHHDGGALAFGPDQHLYVGTGDAGDPTRSQDRDSLGGKILRVEPDGDPAFGNQREDSPVWSLGHRNVQGFGWSSTGQMFASEFGQDAYDELNRIRPGGNYGWPDVEGPGDPADDGFVEPIAWWSPEEASPSGLAVTDEAVYLAGLRGETLWRVPFHAIGKKAVEAGEVGLGRPQPLLTGELGRLRAVVAAGDHDADGLWALTNNTDGRGTPRDGDDRLVRIELG